MKRLKNPMKTLQVCYNLVEETIYPNYQAFGQASAHRIVKLEIHKYRTEKPLCFNNKKRVY